MTDRLALSQRLIIGPFHSLKAVSHRLLPGVLFCLLVVFAANYLTNQYGGPPVLCALLLGMAFNSISGYGEFASGLDFCATHLMRAGVAFLGAGISVTQIAELGLTPLLLVASVVVATLCFSLALGWLLKVRRVNALISGAAVAICGASAALAVAAVLPHSKSSEKHLLCTLVGVTSLSTLAMIFYPALLGYLGFSSQQMGLFFGAAIHDVAQVLGAGHMVSDEVTQLATYTKMLRVAALVPVVAVISLFFLRRSESSASLAVVPPFLIAFIGFAVLANVQVLPQELVSTMSRFSALCLMAAMAALGTKTNLMELWQLGKKPMLLLVFNTIFIAGLALAIVSI